MTEYFEYYKITHKTNKLVTPFEAKIHNIPL